jgi:hypothetical protein
MIEWSEQHLMIQDMIRKFVAAEGVPNLEQLEHGDLPPYATMRKLVDAFGLAEVEVYARPQVAILSTGNEIVDPGRPLEPGHIYDINRFTLSAIISEHGGIPVPCRTAEDTVEDLSRALDEAATSLGASSLRGFRDRPPT